MVELVGIEPTGWIRTSNLLRPRQGFYQVELRSNLRKLGQYRNTLLTKDNSFSLLVKVANLQVVQVTTT